MKAIALIEAIDALAAQQAAVGKRPNSLFITSSDWNEIIAIIPITVKDHIGLGTTYNGMSVFFIKEGSPRVAVL